MSQQQVTAAVQALTDEAHAAMLLAIRRALLQQVAKIETEVGLSARHCRDCPLRR